jgi:iron complex outermembrane receptor protein
VPAEAQHGNGSLKHLSLEELLTMEVTSVSKKEQKLGDAPAAIFVITQQDLARAGVTTIAEALRMVPGLSVSRIDGNKWAISSRGFNGRFADKMLVLIDGRSVYTPLFSGVYWELQDLLLTDVDRIEVIRGPGSTMWGSNAVNGVINILTKPASQTHGVQVSTLIGSEERAATEARYGAPLGARADFRLFVKQLDRRASVDPTGADAADAWHTWRVGGQLDWQRSPDETLTIAGAAYTGDASTTYGPGSLVPLEVVRRATVADLAGGHLRGRWTRAMSSRADIAVQGYFDRTSRIEANQMWEYRNTVDVEFQHRQALRGRQDLMWGAGFRSTSDELRPGPAITFADLTRTDRLVSFFVQDEFALVPSRVHVTTGAKVEHNSYSGWEWQPDVRVRVAIDARHTVWGAVSRGVRTPSRAENDITITAPAGVSPEGLPLIAAIMGNPDFVSETMRAHEAGYRWFPHAAVSVDVAAFHNVYDHLRTFETGAPAVILTPAGPAVQIPALFGNQMEGRARGVELSGGWTPASDVRIDGTYSFVDVRLQHKPGSLDTIGIIVEDDSPRHQARLHAGATLAERVDVDLSAAYTAPLRKQQIPAYVRVDARLAWRLGTHASIAVGGRNLTDAAHQEFGSTLGEMPTLVRRSAYVQLGWRH